MWGWGYAQRGWEDSQALSRDPLEVRREAQGDSERWVMEGLDRVQAKSSIASHWPRAVGWGCLIGNLISNLGNLPAKAIYMAGYIHIYPSICMYCPARIESGHPPEAARTTVLWGGGWEVSYPASASRVKESPGALCV